MRHLLNYVLAGILCLSAPHVFAAKVLGLKVIDKNYLMLHVRDGEVHYRDSGTGPSAYLGHSFSPGDDTASRQSRPSRLPYGLSVLLTTKHSAPQHRRPSGASRSQ